MLDLEAVQDVDHVVAVFRVGGALGRRSGARTTRACATASRSTARCASWPLSYFESYFNLRREKTLRRYSVPVDLSRFDRRRWMTAEDDLWDIPEYLVGVRHFPLVTAARGPAAGHRGSRGCSRPGLVGRRSAGETGR